MATELDTAPLFEALRQPMALVESDERKAAIETYIEAARTPLERAIFDLTSQLVEGVSEQVKDHYRVRLNYRPGGLSVEVDERAGNGEEVQYTAMEGGDVEKITIRIPAELKDLAQQAASNAGTSANTWFVKALARAVKNIDVQTAPPPSWREQGRDERRAERRESRGPGRGARLSGWVGEDE